MPFFYSIILMNVYSFKRMVEIINLRDVSLNKQTYMLHNCKKYQTVKISYILLFNNIIGLFFVTKDKNCISAQCPFYMIPLI